MSSDDSLVKEDTQVLQTHLVDTDQEFDALAHILVPIDDAEMGMNASRREIALTIGGPDITLRADEPLAILGNEKHNAQVTAFRDRAMGLGYFLHALETADLSQSGIPTDEIGLLAALHQQFGMDAYFEQQKTMTMTDRRLRLLDLWDWRVEHGDFAAEVYQAEATWRSTNLSGGAERMAQRIASDVPPRPKLCYYSAGEAAIHEIDNDRVTYVEGIALPKHACQAIRHAWIEIDGEVAELTWPWHQFDGAEAVYIGQQVDKAQVKATRERRDFNGPVLLNDDQIQTVGAAMGDANGDTP